MVKERGRNTPLYYLPMGIAEIMSQHGQIFQIGNALSDKIAVDINANTHNIDKRSTAYKAVEKQTKQTAQI